MSKVTPSGAANDSSMDRVLAFVMRWTMPVAVARIVAALVFYWWLLDQ